MRTILIGAVTLGAIAFYAEQAPPPGDNELNLADLQRPPEPEPESGRP